MTATRQYGAWARCCPTARSAPLGLVRVVTAAGALGDHSPARVSGSEPSPRSASGSAGRGHRRGGDRANSDRPRLRPEAAVRGSVGSGQLGAALRSGAVCQSEPSEAVGRLPRPGPACQLSAVVDTRPARSGSSLGTSTGTATGQTQGRSLRHRRTCGGRCQLGGEGHRRIRRSSIATVTATASGKPRHSGCRTVSDPAWPHGPEPRQTRPPRLRIRRFGELSPRAWCTTGRPERGVLT